jgi:predicted nuclease of restriction endonuclease-like RecB superfamily
VARYLIELSGPASVLRETRRYGINFARFLPALLACRGWTMRATLRTPWGGTALLALTSRDGLQSTMPPPEEFDSSVEAGFAAKFGPERDGWRLHREAQVLVEGQSAFVPDFAFRHADGTEVLLEIVGFWTPEYLAKKRETLRRFRGRRIYLAVAERCLPEGAAVSEDVVVYKSALKPEPVLALLERARKSSMPLPA